MILVTVRHYVSNIEQVGVLERISREIIKSQKDNMGIEYRLSLNYPKELSREIREKVYNVDKVLLENSISVDSYVGYGAGYAFLKSVFNYLAESNRYYKDKQKIIFLIDGEQFDITDKRVTKSILNISESLSLNNLSTGLALRDFFVASEDPTLDEIRKIEELYHMKTCTNISINNPQNITTRNIHPLYLKYGDIIPGFYGFNLESKVFNNALPLLISDCSKTDLTNFQADPYFIMLLGILAKQRGETFYSEVIPTLRTIRGSRFDKETVIEKTRSLKNTFVGTSYKSTLKDELFNEELSRFFKQENVVLARNMILQGLD